MIPWQVGCVVPVLQFNLWIELQSTDLDLAQSQVVGFEGKHAEICRGQSNMRKREENYYSPIEFPSIWLFTPNIMEACDHIVCWICTLVYHGASIMSANGKDCFGLKINELPSCIAKDIFKALCRWPGDLFSRTLSGHHRETSTAGSECHTGMGKEWLQVCSPQVQSHKFHCTMVSGSETPHCENWKHTSASGGVHKVPWAVVGLAPLI